METKKLHIHACGCIHLLDYFCGEKPNKTDKEEIDFVTYQVINNARPDMYCEKCLLSLTKASKESQKKIKLRP